MPAPDPPTTPLSCLAVSASGGLIDVCRFRPEKTGGPIGVATTADAPDGPRSAARSTTATVVS
eukprot:3592603-Lingulodinium_polyedra.AAC.1